MVGKHHDRLDWLTSSFFKKKSQQKARTQAMWEWPRVIMVGVCHSPWDPSADWFLKMLSVMVHDSKPWAGKEAEKQAQSFNCLLLVGRVSSHIYLFFAFLWYRSHFLKRTFPECLLGAYALNGDIFHGDQQKRGGPRCHRQQWSVLGPQEISVSASNLW